MFASVKTTIDDVNITQIKSMVKIKRSKEVLHMDPYFINIWGYSNFWLIIFNPVRDGEVVKSPICNFF